ncbi:MAG: molecular chaperone, partial [Bosea sp.]|nr:molecular chaperone [Bosea sp. (in: a-proteobacteria)]
VAPLLSGSARAQSGTSLVIWPIDPSIPSGHQATALWLENRGDRPLTLQVRVVGWTTVDFDEVFVGEQEAVIASPPIAEVPAGQKQLVRLVRVAPAPVGREQAFRVIVDELPRPDRPQTPATQVAIGVSLRLVVQEVFLDDVCLVAKAKDEVLVAEMGVVLHQMPEDRTRADLHHRFRDVVDIAPQPHAHAAAKEYDLHDALPLQIAACRRGGLSQNAARAFGSAAPSSP